MITLDLNPLAGTVRLEKELACNSSFLEYFNIPIASYEFSIKDFYNILKKNFGEEKETPILPYGTVFYSEKKNYDFIIIKYEEKPFLFTHAYFPELKNLKMYFPECYFMFVLSKGTEKDDKYSIVKTFIMVEHSNVMFSKLDILEKRYALSPFPNYSETYSSGICWGYEGSVNKEWTKESPDIFSLSTGLDRYISSPFNDDLSPYFSTEDLITYISGMSWYSDFLYFLRSKMNNSDSLINIESFFHNYNKNLIYYLFLHFYAEKERRFPVNFSSVLGFSRNTISELIKNPFI